MSSKLDSLVRSQPSIDGQMEFFLHDTMSLVRSGQETELTLKVSQVFAKNLIPLRMKFNLNEWRSLCHEEADFNLPTCCHALNVILVAWNNKLCNVDLSLLIGLLQRTKKCLSETERLDDALYTSLAVSFIEIGYHRDNTENEVHLSIESTLWSVFCRLSSECSKERLSNFTPKGLTQFLWGCKMYAKEFSTDSSEDSDVHERHLTKVLDLTTRILKEEKLSFFSLDDLRELLEASEAIGYSLLSEDREKKFRRIIRKVALNKLNDLSPVQLANFARQLSHQYVSVPMYAQLFLIACITQAVTSETLKNLRVQEILYLLTAADKITHVKDDLKAFYEKISAHFTFEVLSKLAVHEILELANLFPESEVGNVGFFGKLSKVATLEFLQSIDNESLGSLMCAFAASISAEPAFFQRVSMLLTEEKIQTLEISEIEDVLWTFKKVKIFDRALLTRIGSYVVSDKCVFTTKSVNHFSGIISGFSYFQVYEPHLMSKFGNYISSKKQIRSLSFLSLVKILPAYTFLDVPVFFLDQLNSELLEASVAAVADIAAVFAEMDYVKNEVYNLPPDSKQTYDDQFEYYAKVALAKAERQKNSGQTFDSKELSSLFFAAAGYKGRMELTKKLLEMGVDPDIVDTKHSKYAILHCLVINDSLDLVALLLDYNPNVEIRNGDMFTPLHMASVKSKANSLSILSMLVKAGADINARAHGGRTCLHFAMQHTFPNDESQTAMISMLLNLGGDLGIYDDQFRLPIDFISKKQFLSLWKEKIFTSGDYLPLGMLVSNSNDMELLYEVLPGIHWELFLSDFSLHSSGIGTFRPMIEYCYEGGNPYVLCFMIKVPGFHTFLESSIPEEMRQTLREDFKVQYPKYSYYAEPPILKRPFPMPVRIERQTLDIPPSYTLTSAVKTFKRQLAAINFNDPYGENYVGPSKIMDQNMPSTPMNLKIAVEKFCKVALDPTQSDYWSEKQDPDSYSELNQKFVKAMYGLHLHQKKMENPNISREERNKIKQTIDRQVILIGFSGNHCLTAKNDAATETSSLFYTGFEDQSLLSQVAQNTVYRRRALLDGIIASVQPPIDQHHYTTFLATHGRDVGIQEQNLLRQDPFVPVQATLQLFPLIMSRFLQQYDYQQIVVSVFLGLHRKPNEISRSLFYEWMIDNVPEDWDFWEELERDTHRMSQSTAMQYLKKFDLSITPEIAIKIHFAPQIAKEHLMTLQMPKAEARRVNEENFAAEKDRLYTRIFGNQETPQTESEAVIALSAMELEVVSLQEKEEALFAQEIEKLQDEVQKVMLAENSEEISQQIAIKKLQISQLESADPITDDLEQAVIRRITKQRLVNEFRSFLSKKKKKELELTEKMVANFFLSLSLDTNSITANQLIAYYKHNMGFYTLRNRMEGKTVSQKWEILFQTGFFTSKNEKLSPEEALIKFFGERYALSGEKNGQFREDRLSHLLMKLDHLALK